MTVASENSIQDATVYRKITCCSHSKFVLELEHSPQELSVTNTVICFIFLLKRKEPLLSWKNKKRESIDPLFTIWGIQPKTEAESPEQPGAESRLTTSSLFSSICSAFPTLKDRKRKMEWPSAESLPYSVSPSLEVLSVPGQCWPLLTGPSLPPLVVLLKEVYPSLQNLEDRLTLSRCGWIFKILATHVQFRSFMTWYLPFFWSMNFSLTSYNATCTSQPTEQFLLNNLRRLLISLALL